MTQYYYLDQKVIIKLCEIYTHYNKSYYPIMIGLIKGVKTVSNCKVLYLVEFLNYDRIWFTINEVRQY